MGNFNGMLNSKARYGQSWGDNQTLSFKKYCALMEICIPHSGLWLKWNKRTKLIYPSWGKGLWNWGGDISWTQRHANKWRKKKRIEFFPWRS